MKQPILIFTDGGARGNPGPAAVGVVITDNERKETIHLAKRIGRTTNNVAEYTAVITALIWIKENSKFSDAEFFLDSLLIVNQLNGLFKIKDNKLRELIIKVRGLEREIGGNISYHYVPREKNKMADRLVNQALDNEE